MKIGKINDFEHYTTQHKYKTKQRQYDNEIHITELTIIQNQINIKLIYASSTTNYNDRTGKMLIDEIEGSNFVLLHEN